ncbi:MAG TPA: acyl carrier protein [Flavobacteriales bacterium]|jgi:acyl carrier protein|nr:acyl carrier protein [Flavobacteriales bacterium]
MNKSQLIETVNAFLIDEFEVDENEIVAEANLQEALDLDSLDYVDLVVIIESNFGFKATGEDFQSIVTFQDFYDFLCEKVNCDQ